MRNESHGRLTNPGVWQEKLPEQVFQGLVEWVAGRAADVTHLRWLTGGRSGSYVTMVRTRPRYGTLRNAILKLVPPALALTETHAVDLARQYGPAAFVDAHIVPTTWAGPLPGGSGYWLHLQEIAQYGTATMLPLRELVDDGQFGAYCRTIVTAISSQWNVDRPDPAPLTTTPGAFLRADLEHASEGLHAFTAMADIDTERPLTDIRLPGRTGPLPNPFALLVPGVDGGPELPVFRGSGHGDLNPGNVFVPLVDGSVAAERFLLIDIGRFSPELPVSRDPAKLLLSVAAGWLSGLAEGSAIRSSLAELITTPSEAPTSPPTAGYRDVALAIHDAAVLWAVARHVVDEWRRQHRLVLAASALRTVADRELSPADRWWYLEVAALALAPLLASTGAADSAGQPTPPTAHRPEPAEAVPAPVGAPSSRTAAGTPSNRTAGRVPPTPSAGMVKVEFCRHLGDDWMELTDVVGIRPHERMRFAPGQQARGIWEWLEVRGRLPELPGYLVAIGRDDLGGDLPPELLA